MADRRDCGGARTVRVADAQEKRVASASRSVAVERASKLMLAFAERTGIESSASPRRYLWTDAHAVCNFIGLARVAADEPRHRRLALALVDQVHHVLGRHRPDDSRTGWISGLSASAGEAHPTRGGLRIGKPLPERRVGDPFDPQVEWDRDGQYFHYLTKWIHALHLVARAEQDPRYDVWARELAATAHAAFVRPTGAAGGGMVWKMSIDLSRPLVPSTGQHDPLDGLLTTAELRAGPGAQPELDAQLATYRGLVAAADFATEDPLGIGGMLVDVCRLAQLARTTKFDQSLSIDLMRSALQGLERWAFRRDLDRAAASRLGFRELGLAIGLRAIDTARAELGGRFARGAEAHVLLDAIGAYAPLGDKLVAFWLDEKNRASTSWAEHQDINDVMLATALVPHEYLDVVGRPLPKSS